MNFIKQEMLDKNADGVVFYPIFTKDEDIFIRAHCEYTLDEIDDVKLIPKSDRSYYKLVNGKKVLIK